MGLFDDVNGSKSTVMDGVDTSEMEYVKLKDFIGRKVPLKGFFFSNKGKYGKSVVCVSDSVLINMPNWAVSKFEKILNNDAQLEAVVTGRAALDNIQELDTGKGNKTASFDIVEM